MSSRYDELHQLLRKQIDAALTRRNNCIARVNQYVGELQQYLGIGHPEVMHLNGEDRKILQAEGYSCDSYQRNGGDYPAIITIEFDLPKLKKRYNLLIETEQRDGVFYFHVEGQGFQLRDSADTEKFNHFVATTLRNTMTTMFNCNGGRAPIGFRVIDKPQNEKPRNVR